MVRDTQKPPVRGKTSAYGFFVKMCYEEHKKKYPTENVQVTEISKKCSEKWRTMTDDEKKRFFELAQKDAERYAQEMAQYGGEDAMRKRKRAKKDPNAPKRALSAFFFFSQEKRAAISAAHQDWKVGQVAQELGRMWKALTDDEKKVYEKMSIDDKARYEHDMRDYKATGNFGPGQSGMVTPQMAHQQQPQQHMANQMQQQPQQQQQHMQQQLQQQQMMQQQQQQQQQHQQVQQQPLPAHVMSQMMSQQPQGMPQQQHQMLAHLGGLL